ncbi:DEDD exonuclease domain-containing protein [Pilimelia columellifera]|uniref:GIY-YIG domain-containing protein n=1 Tax=Pilimelia columellifera subsp. columellifera TaxID=706583 RepID=A0ABN3NAA3_9ACTN
MPDDGRQIPHPPTIDARLDDPHQWSLSRVTFVVLDLETTGGAPDGGGITEIGAVRVRGGERLGTLSTLVNPGVPVPPFITALTGISSAMVAGAPPLAAVLPTVLEFLAGATLVAHNAPYDVGFLKAACLRLGYRWPAPPVLDTLALARRLFADGEVPNRRLGTLAAHLRTPHQPSHRALDDAETTVDVLHALLERLGGDRPHTLGEVIAFARSVSPSRRAKRHLAKGLPHAPGVYVFRAADDRPLYVGASVDIASRVRGYFTAAERRRWIDEMITAAVRVEAMTCAHPLEAQVRELRLIAAHDPPYNRRPRRQDRTMWPNPTAETCPRLSIVRQRRADHDGGLGLLPSRRAAELAAALLRTTIRHQRLAGLAAVAELVAARRHAGGGWELAVVRHGRLAAAGVSPPGSHPRASVDVLVAAAETPPPTPGRRCASAQETETILRWLEAPETRLFRVSHGWASPVAGAARFTTLLARLDAAARDHAPSAD